MVSNLGFVIELSVYYFKPVASKFIFCCYTAACSCIKYIRETHVIYNREISVIRLLRIRRSCADLEKI